MLRPAPTFGSKQLVEFNSIEWHRECLRNRQHHLGTKVSELMRLKAEVDRLRSEVAVYESQIEMAVAKGKTKFDPERFGKKRPARPGEPK